MRLLVLSLLFFSAFPAAAQWATVQTNFEDEIQGGPGFLLHWELDYQIFASRDGGVTFTGTPVESPVVGFARSLFAEPRDGALVGWVEHTADRWGFYRTTDGLTWTRLVQLGQSDDRERPHWIGQALLASDRPGHLLRSLDGGASWDSIPNVPFDQDVTPTTLGAVGTRAYVATFYNRTTQTYYSDNLATWTPSPDSIGYDLIDFDGQAALALAQPVGLELEIVGGKVVFTTYGLRHTTDGGRTWKRQALPRWKDRDDVGVSKDLLRIDAQTAFTSTGDYIALTRDAGATWAITDSVGGGRLSTIDALTTDGTYLFYVDIWDEVLRRRPLADYALTTAAAPPAEMPRASLQLSGPHPVRETVRLDVETPGAATLTVSNVLGRTVAARSVNASGPVDLDASAWAPGWYVVRMVAGGTVVTRTFVVAR